MGTDNGNGKWTIAFWVMTAIAVVGLGTLGGYVIANDSKRATEDQRIEANLIKTKDEIKDCLTEIKTKLATIETKVDLLGNKQ